MTTEEKMFEETFALYQEQGVKFTMDDLAKRLFISKKTLYELVRSKEKLIERAMRHYFDAVEREQRVIREDKSRSALEKTVLLLCVVPQMPLQQYRIRELRRAFPQAYLQLTAWLETGWEKTFSVMDEAVSQGALAPFDHALFAKIYAYVIEGLMLEQEQRTTADFAEEQKRAVEMLLGGICSTSGKAQLSAKQD
jgi:Bacterial regulatory proteins, tetR family.